MSFHRAAKLRIGRILPPSADDPGRAAISFSFNHTISSVENDHRPHIRSFVCICILLEFVIHYFIYPETLTRVLVAQDTSVHSTHCPRMKNPHQA
jgi:hypothetical protein